VAHVLSFSAAALLAVLVAANIVLAIAKLAHQDRLAATIVRLAAPVVWLLRLGGDGDSHPRRTDGHIGL
jgi:hypothetical protein